MVNSSRALQAVVILTLTSSLVIVGWLFLRDPEPGVMGSGGRTLDVPTLDTPTYGDEGSRIEIATDADSPPPPTEVSPVQRLMTARLGDLLSDDVPQRLLTRGYDDDLVNTAAAQVEIYRTKMLQVRQKFQGAARQRAREVLEAGRFERWRPQPVTIPDPDAPGRTVERLSTPYDEQREDEYILAVAAPEVGPRVLHVVRLTPQSDSAFGQLYDSKTRSESEIRASLLRWLDDNLP